MNKNYNLSCEKIKEFLNKKVNKENLNQMCEKYNIIFDSDDEAMEQLIDVLTEDDLSLLGFDFDTINSKTIEEIEDSFEYPDVSDIVNFLANYNDEAEIDILCQNYDCYSLEDLALALTDSELEYLGYGSDEKIEDIFEKPEDESLYGFLEYFDNSEYVDDFDYLEDLPNDLKYYNLGDGVYLFDDDVSLNNFIDNLDSRLIDDTTIENIDERYALTIKPHKYEINEEVIINDELNSNIFDENHQLKPELKEIIINYINGFIDKMKNQDINIEFSDVCLVGSNAGYLYTPTSDIDIHIVSSNPLEPDIAEKLYNEFDIYESENPLFIGDSQVEIGIEDGYDITMDNKDARRYSIINDNWVNDSDKFEVFTQDDIHKVDGYEDIVADYINKINSAVDEDNYNLASALKQEIRQNRSDDLANIGALSMGNVVFKELRSNGSYGKLRDYLRKKELGGILNE